jgi:hypothetical protein
LQVESNTSLTLVEIFVHRNLFLNRTF